MSNQERRPRVYIPNEGVHSYAAAEEFGNLVFVTKGNLSRFKVGFIYRAFMDAMKGSEKHDYFVPSSLNVMNCIGASILSVRHGVLNLLLYDRGKYFERTLDMAWASEKDQSDDE